MTLINNLLNLSSSIVAKVNEIVTSMPTIACNKLRFHNIKVSASNHTTPSRYQSEFEGSD